MKLIHLSDLHFGTESPSTVCALQQEIKKEKPGYIVISGDLTQAASHGEFKKAKNFLNNLPCPYLVVPGNHDIPANNLWERAFAPYKKYKQYISSELDPFWGENDVSIVGLNSSRPILPHWNWANGLISANQLNDMKDRFRTFTTKWKVAMLHHPLVDDHDSPIRVTVFGSKNARNAMHEASVDIVLSGHVHHASIKTHRDEKTDHITIYVSASTALSSRTRKQENGFNIIHFFKDTISVKAMVLCDGRFVEKSCFRHKKI